MVGTRTVFSVAPRVPVKKLIIDSEDMRMVSKTESTSLLFARKNIEVLFNTAGYLKNSALPLDCAFILKIYEGRW
jgi:hypothetical protein